MYNTLSKRMLNQFFEFDSSDPSQKPTLQNPSAQSQVEQMVRNISNEITRMTEAEREQVKSDLASQAREWCLRDISHDLRTPLNAIIGFTQMMESGVFGPVGNPQYIEYLRHIRESGYELLDKVEDLIDTVSPEKPFKLSAVSARKQVKKPELKEALA